MRLRELAVYRTLTAVRCVAEAEAVVTAYGARGPRAGTAVDVLAAKVWTVVEFAAQADPGAGAERGATARASVLASLRPGLAHWLEGLDPLVRRV